MWDIRKGVLEKYKNLEVFERKFEVDMVLEMIGNILYILFWNIFIFKLKIFIVLYRYFDNYKIVK